MGHSIPFIISSNDFRSFYSVLQGLVLELYRFQPEGEYSFLVKMKVILIDGK